MPGRYMSASRDGERVRAADEPGSWLCLQGSLNILRHT